MGVGPLRVINQDHVAPGAGFDTHGHRDMEIISYVLEGALEHKDSIGTGSIIRPGEIQRMSAGTGIRHSEHNPSDANDVHFVQMWVLPDTAGVEPSYEQLDINDALDGGGLVPIASGQGHDGAISIHQRDAVLWGGRLRADELVDVPVAPHVHVFVAKGSGRLADDHELGTGDAARLTDASSMVFCAGGDGAEVLIWATG